MNTDAFNNMRSRQQPAQQPGGYVSYEASPNETQFQTEHQHSPISPIGSGSYFKAYGSTGVDTVGKSKIPKWAFTTIIIVVVVLFVFMVYYLVSSRTSNSAEESRLHRTFNENLMRTAESIKKNAPVNPPSRSHHYQPPARTHTVTTPAPTAHNVNRNIVAQPAPPKEDKTAYVSSYDVSDDDPQEEEKEEANEVLDDDGTGPHDVDYDAYGHIMNEKNRQSELDKQIKEQEDYELKLEQERLSKGSDDKVPKKKKILSKGKSKSYKEPVKKTPSKKEEKKKEEPTTTAAPAEKESTKKEPVKKDIKEETKNDSTKKDTKDTKESKSEPEKKSSTSSDKRTTKTTPEPKKAKKPEQPKKQREKEYKRKRDYDEDDEYDHDHDDHDYDEEDFARAMNLLLQQGKKVKESRKYKKRNIKGGRKNFNPYASKYDEKEEDDSEEDEDVDRKKHHWDSFGMDDHGDERDDEYDQQYNTPKYRAPERPKRK